MMNWIGILTMVFCLALDMNAQPHPRLTLTFEGVEKIKEKEKAPLFYKTLEKVINEVDGVISEGVLVPVPKDMAGGYTHEIHKRNFFILQKAGVLYQISGKEHYAQYIKDVLLAYAEMYPKLGKHPTDRSYATGKIFWQCLNDANWLVYVSQAYDCIYDYLSAEQRSYLEENLFIPFADFISIENPRFFNRIHNHSTWGNAAVGMLALVIDDQELLERALYGIDSADIDPDAMDNDGGLIKLPGANKAGFMANLDHGFSPDGYYTEGPYYQRYAMSPYILFAQALENVKPELKIFEYRDSLLKKATFALIQQSTPNGVFFPINDAQKGMSFKSREVISAVNIVYDYCGNDSRLLSIAEKQGMVHFDHTGYTIARDIAKNKHLPFYKGSVLLRDGANGDEGALGILRSKKDENEFSVLFKMTAQGMGHGHFDKLSYSVFDNNVEVLQDYGAARWVNIDQKAGGRYLPENNSWAKQTIAHNTIVLNETSHFTGSTKIGNSFHSEVYYFNSSDKNVIIASGKERNAYPGSQLHRTLFVITDPIFDKPAMLDIYKVTGGDVHATIDLPFHFQTQLLDTDLEINTDTTTLKPLGTAHGYQHAWREGTSQPSASNSNITWFTEGGFYTLTFATSPADEIIFARSGANDPKFNLRRDAFFIQRKRNIDNTLFVSLLRPHGTYNPVDEIPIYPYAKPVELKVIHDSKDYTIIKLKAERKEWTFLMDNIGEKAMHEVNVSGEMYKWEGKIAYEVCELKN